MVRYFVEFFYRGHTVPKTTIKEIDSSNATIVVPDGAFAYRTFERIETEYKGKIYRSEDRNFSPFVYIGKEYTLEEVKKQFPEENLLIINMEVKGCNRAVKTRINSWHILKKEDTVIE